MPEHDWLVGRFEAHRDPRQRFTLRDGLISRLEILPTHHEEGADVEPQR